MALANVLLVLSVGLGPLPTPGSGPAPGVLVAQLGSPRYAEREAATAALRAMGPAALPALRSARSARDAEVRARAAALLDRVESELMIRPTLVRLDYVDRPLTDVVKDIGRQSGINLGIDSDNPPGDGGARTVTLLEDEPLPFWKAMDRLCEAGRLQMNLGPRGSPFDSGATPGINFFDDDHDGPPGPTSDSGPFRAKVLSLHYTRNKSLDHARANGGSAVEEQFFIQMELMAEPRLMLCQSRPLKLLEAIDDRGHSLLPPASDDDPTQEDDEVFVDNGFGQGAILRLQVNLKYPAKPGETIKRFRGLVPVVVASRKADPAVIPLAGASGKTFRRDDVTFVVHGVKPDADNSGTAIDVTVRPGDSRDAFADRERNAPFGSTAASPQSLETQIEIVDAQGKIVPWSPSNLEIEGGGLRITMMAPSIDEVGPPVKLRYYSLTRASAEIPFSFTDVPMP